MKLNIHLVKTKEQFAQFLPLYREAQTKPPTAKIIKNIEKDFSSSSHPFTILLANLNTEPVGFMIIIETYSSSLARKTIYLEEFHIKETHQNQGIGRQLFQYLTHYAKQQKIARIEWITHKKNIKAQQFYKKYPTNNEHVSYVLLLDDFEKR